VGTNRGLLRFDGTTCHTVKAAGAPDWFITSIHQDAKDTIWVGAKAGGLNVVRGDELVPESTILEADDVVEVRSVISGGA